ncbi:MAG: hypothetical protein WBW94_04845, partial [Anaerolineales bacterium]
IYPPSSKKGGRKTKNVFSNFYEIVTGTNWPYQTAITLKPRDFIGYCNQISHETKVLFNIDRRMTLIQSLYREVQNEMWFEMAVPKDDIDLVKPLAMASGFNTLEYEALTPVDKQDWLSAFHKTSQLLINLNILQTAKKQFDDTNKIEVASSLLTNAKNCLEDYAVAPIDIDATNPAWLFVPKINLVGSDIFWHPILSDYLISFILATILRYQPQLLKAGSPNHFISQAWCTQSAQSTLVYFLLMFTDPPILVKAI